ncbi:MAG TPA: hypothetical protein VM821_03840 [Abditibacteriaceae bacterium]|jgi:hypothetical protein|nr:hypothetical protein [Abditibacteriaceae bacterium]
MAFAAYFAFGTSRFTKNPGSGSVSELQDKANPKRSRLSHHQNPKHFCANELHAAASGLSGKDEPQCALLRLYCGLINEALHDISAL